QVLIIRQGPAPQPTATSVPPTQGPTNTAPPPTATQVPQRLTHTVQRGETLSHIALRYGVTVQELVQLNNIANPHLIYPCQVLVIRPGPQPTATAVPPTATIAPTSTQDPNAPPTASPTALPGGIPTPTPIVRPTISAPLGPNLFANPGFEGNARQVGATGVNVV